jgi:CheY-like chemotaxis protein
LTSEVVVPKSPKTVLIIDDNKIESAEYRDQLKRHSAYTLDIVVCNSASGYEAAAGSRPAWDIVVVDIMMPPGTVFNRRESGDGRFTGLLVAEQIREKYVHVPILLLSGTPFDDVREVCEKFELKLHNCIFWTKERMPPLKLAKKLDKYFDSGELEKRDPTFWSKIFDAIILKPSIYGVGVDLTKIVKKS